MDTTRAYELPLEQHGLDASPPDSVKDWHADRLSVVILSMEAQLKAAVAERLTKGLGDLADGDRATKGLEALKQAATTPKDREDLARFLEKEMSQTDTFMAEVFAGEKASKHSARLEPGMPLALTTYHASATAVAPSYMGLSAETCQPGSDLERICERAHALVEKGYISGQELNKMEMAILDKESVRERAGHALHEISRAAGIPFSLPKPSNIESSAYDSATEKVYISKQESKLVFPSHDTATATAEVFSHELGHFLSRGKLLAVVDHGVKALEQQGGKEGALASQFIKVPEKYLKTNSPDFSSLHDSTGATGIIGRSLGEGGSGATWAGAAAEMYGDCMAIAAEKAVHGNEAAIKFGNEFSVRRDQLNQEFIGKALQAAGAMEKLQGPFYGETHHTTAAVDHFVAAIKDGRIDAVRSPGQLDALIGESIAKGLVEEYTKVRVAELNLHQVKDGVAVPGLPDGISEEAVLLAELKHNVNYAPGQPKIIVPDEMLKDLPEGTAVNKLTVIDNAGKPQTLNIADKVPSGVTAKLEPHTGILGLKEATAESEKQHLSQLPADPGKALSSDSQQQQQASKAESTAPQPAAEMSR